MVERSREWNRGGAKDLQLRREQDFIWIFVQEFRSF